MWKWYSRWQKLEHMFLEVESVWITSLNMPVVRNAVVLSCFPWYNKTNIDCWPRSTLKNYAPQLCNVTLGPSALWQHYTTSGHNFSVLTSAPVNICIMWFSVCSWQHRHLSDDAVCHLCKLAFSSPWTTTSECRVGSNAKVIATYAQIQSKKYICPILKCFKTN